MAIRTLSLSSSPSAWIEGVDPILCQLRIQYREDDSRGPAKKEDSIHRGQRAEQLPLGNWHDVAVAEGREVHEREIEWVDVFGADIEQVVC